MNHEPHASGRSTAGAARAASAASEVGCGAGVGARKLVRNF